MVVCNAVLQEQDNYKNSDALRRQLEAELRDVTARLEEAESVAQKEGKRLVVKLQAKVNTTSQSVNLICPTAVCSVARVPVVLLHVCYSVVILARRSVQ